MILVASVIVPAQLGGLDNALFGAAVGGVLLAASFLLVDAGDRGESLRERHARLMGRGVAASVALGVVALALQAAGALTLASAAPLAVLPVALGPFTLYALAAAGSER